jgi:hypothetical protein
MPLFHNRQPNPERNEPTTRTSRDDRAAKRDVKRETRVENAKRDMHRRPFEEGR